MDQRLWQPLSRCLQTKMKRKDYLARADASDGKMRTCSPHLVFPTKFTNFFLIRFLMQHCRIASSGGCHYLLNIRRNFLWLLSVDRFSRFHRDESNWHIEHRDLFVPNFRRKNLSALCGRWRLFSTQRLDGNTMDYCSICFTDRTLDCRLRNFFSIVRDVVWNVLLQLSFAHFAFSPGLCLAKPHILSVQWGRFMLQIGWRRTTGHHDCQFLSAFYCILSLHDCRLLLLCIFRATVLLAAS